MFLASPAAAVHYRAQWNPPKRFDHPYHGHLILHEVPQYRIPGMCRSLFREHGDWALANEMTSGAKGCAWVEHGTCDVIIVNRLYHNSTPADVFRHERGHCNGWPANHPN